MLGRPARVPLVVVALVIALLASPGPTSAADPVVVANPTFASGTSDWKPTSKAAVKRVVGSDGRTAGQVALKKSSTKKTTIGITSTASDRLPAAGTVVHVAGQVRSSQTGKKIIFRLRELSPDGKELQRFDGVNTPSTTGWYWTGAKLTTQRPDSRVQLYVHEIGVTGKNHLQLRTISSGLTTPPTTQAPPGTTRPPTPGPTGTCAAIDYSDSAQGRRVFSDEFTGSRVDTTKWRVRDGESLSFDKARILARNVTVHDGMLDIAGKRESVDGRKYTTGYVDTIGKFSQKYGRWEMRAKVPTDGARTRGVWPAFWLRGDTTPGEIDVMETWGSPAEKSFDPSVSNSWTVWRDTNAGGPDKFTGWSHPQGHQPAIYSDYHVYAVNWSPTCMAFSFDGRIVGTVDIKAAHWLTTSFDSPFNIRLNMQVGSKDWGDPDDTNTKPRFNFLVDYVRAYAPHR